MLGVFVGFLATAETAYPIVTLLMFVLGYFGGLFQPVSHMPGFPQGVANVLPSERQATLGFNMLSGRSLGVTNLLVLAAYTAVLSVVTVWKHRREKAWGLAQCRPLPRQAVPVVAPSRSDRSQGLLRHDELRREAIGYPKSRPRCWSATEASMTQAR